MGSNKLTQDEIKAIKKDVGENDINFLHDVIPQLTDDKPVKAEPTQSKLKRMWKCLLVSNCCNSNC